SRTQRVHPRGPSTRERLLQRRAQGLRYPAPHDRPGADEGMTSGFTEGELTNALNQLVREGKLRSRVRADGQREWIDSRKAWPRDTTDEGPGPRGTNRRIRHRMRSAA